MPKYVRLEAGTTDIKLTSLVGEKQEDHWVSGRPVKCSGPGCTYCGADNKARVRYNMAVDWGGEARVLSLPPIAYEMLGKELLAAGAVPPVTVAMRLVGTGANSRYGFIVERPASGHPQQSELGTELGRKGYTEEQIAARFAMAAVQASEEAIEPVITARELGAMLRWLADRVEAGDVLGLEEVTYRGG